MKKSKFLVVAALISCCTVLAACGNGETSSSAETSSTATSSDSDSSESSSSDYSSSGESSSDYSSPSSEASSSSESSSDDSSSSESSSTEPEPENTASVTLTLDENIYAYVYVADISANEHPASTDTRILGSNGSGYETLSATVDIGDYVFIENLNSAANYTVDFGDGNPYTGSLEAYDGVSELVQITGNCSISVTALATSQIAEINNYAPSAITSLSFGEGDRHAIGEEVEYSFIGTQYTSESNAEASAFSYYITINGTTCNPTSVEWISSSNVVYSGTFIMPSDDVTIDLAYYSTTLSDTGFTASFDEDEDGDVQCLSLVDGTVHGINSSITAIMKKAPGVSITGVEYSTDNGATWTDNDSLYVLRTNGNTNSDIWYSTIYGGTFSEGDSVLLRALYTSDNAYYSLSLSNTGNISITSGSYSAHPLVGDSISINYSAVEGKYVKEPATVTDANGNAVDTTTNSTSSLSFTMPACDVYITFNTENQIAVETESNEYLDGEITVRTSRSSTSTLSYVTPGATIYICANPASGYILNGFVVNGEKLTDLQHYSNYSGSNAWYYVSYTLPETATALKISADITRGYTVSNGINSEYASLAIGGSSSASVTYAENDTVTFTITPTAYYSVKDNSVKVSDGTDEITASVTYNEDGSAVGSFSMPSSDVTITAEFDEKATTSLYFDTTSVNGYLRTAYVMGDSSGTVIYNADERESGTYIVGESLSIYVRFDDTSYDYTISAVTSSGTSNVSYSLNDTIMTASYTVTSDLLGFRVTASEKAPLNVVVSIPEGISITYAYYDGTESSRIYSTSQLTMVNSFENVIYSGYDCYIKVESTVEGRGANVSVTDTATGAELGSYVQLYGSSSSDEETWYSFTPTADFTITATFAEYYSVNIDMEEGLSDSDIMIQDVTSSPYTSVTDGDSFTSGSSIRIYNYSYDTVYYYVDYESGEDSYGSLASSGGNKIFTLSSNITIYIRSTEITSIPSSGTEEGGNTGDEEKTATITYVNNDSDTILAGVYDATYGSMLCGNTRAGTTSSAEVETGSSVYISSLDGDLAYIVDFENDAYADLSGPVLDWEDSDTFVIYGNCTITITAA